MIVFITPNIALGDNPTPGQVTDTIQTDPIPGVAEAARAPGWNEYVDWVSMLRQRVAAGRKVLVTSTSGDAKPESIVYAYLRAGGATAAGAWATITTLRPTASPRYNPQADAALPLIPSTAEVHPVGPTASTNVWVILGVGALAVWLLRKWTETEPLDRPRARNRG